METIDSVQINFNPDQLFLLNICLAFLMFGVALDIKLSDFRDIFRQPKAPFVGLFSQLILLPILTILMVYLFSPPTSIALGMVLIGVCPGGNVSNFMVHLAGANAALSVMLTSIVTLSAVILTPLSFGFWTQFVPGSAAFSNVVQVDPFDMIRTILLLIFVPLVLGMSLNHYAPRLTQKINRPVRLFSILIFFSFVIFASIGNWDNIVKYVRIVFLIVLVHNSLGFLMGYGFAKLNRLAERDARAISIETGIQNSGLALILIFNFFDGIGGMAMIAAWWGIWHLISGFVLANWWKKAKSFREQPT